MPVLENRLERRIGLASAVAAIVGEAVAVGIFLTPSGMARALGSPMWILIAWLFSGGIALAGALCYGELASRRPDAGGSYVYLREAYGRPSAFLYGWMSFLVLDPGITAAMATGFGSYAHSAVGASFPLSQKAIALGSVLLLAALNIFGFRLGATVMRTLSAAKISVLLLLAVLGFGLQLGDWSHFVPFVAQRNGAGLLPEALAAAMVLGFFSFGGWWDLSKIAGEVREPTRTLPAAFALGILCVTLLYILTSAVFLYLVPLETVVSDEGFASQVGSVLFGGAGNRLFSAIVAISILGSLAALIATAPRVYYAMAQDRLFFSGIAAVHPTYGTPARAIALQAVVSGLLVVVGTFDEIVAYFFFVSMVFLALSVAGLSRIRRQAPTTDSTYRTPFYPLPPIVFIAGVSVVLVLLLLRNPVQSLIGAGIVALGYPVFRMVFRGNAGP